MFKCKVDGCGRQDKKALGMCRFHYGRHLHKVPLNQPVRMSHKPHAVCAILGCNSPRKGKQWCSKHYQRDRIRGDVNWKPNGRREYGSGKDWHAAANGYILRYDPSNDNSGPNGQVYQHRDVMSGMIGRPLHGNENVHHVNGERADNRPSNLELWDVSQPAGQRVTDRIEWCIGYLSGSNLDAALRLEPSLSDELEKLALELLRRL